MKTQKSRSSGFTLVEILIAVIVLTALISLLLPAIQQAREAARAAICRNNLQQIGVALMSYHDVHSSLPPGCVNRTSPVPFGTRVTREAESLKDISGKEVPTVQSESAVLENQRLNAETDWYRMSWIVQILPQLDQRAMFRKIDFGDPRRSFLTPEDLADFDRQIALLDSDPNFRADMPLPEGVALSLLNCPSSASGVVSSLGVGVSHYAGCYDSRPIMIADDNNGLLYLNSSLSFQNIPDGRSSTLLVGECGGIAMDSGFMTGDFSTLRSTFTQPQNTYRGRLASGKIDETAWFGFSAPHSLSINLLMADGSVQAMNLTTDLEVFRRFGSRNDCLNSTDE